MVVHITRQGAKVIREGRHLIVKYLDSGVQTLFVYRLSQLVIHGNVMITPPALRLLFQEHIDTVFLRTDGRYVGRLGSGEGKNVFLRRKQFQLQEEPEFIAQVAQDVVRGKTMNMLTLLQRLKRRRKLNKAGQCAQQLRPLLKQLEQTSDLEAIRGYEGKASALYFSGLQEAFTPELGFRKRVRRPPTDPVNSVLSLLYTFLMNRCYSAVRQAGLDPYPGFLHALEYGRHSLPLDLAEEFRTIIADSLTLSLFGLGVLKQDDFYRQDDPPLPQVNEQQEASLDQACHDAIGSISGDEDEDQAAEVFDMPDQRLEPTVDEADARHGKGAVRLYSQGFKKVIEAFEKKMQVEFYHPTAQRRVTYSQALVIQALAMRQVIEGEVARYQPLLLK